MSLQDEIQKRRTLAIISHPDAGKTTLTEKLLLYGGAVQLAGSVTARKRERTTTSDWMELEKKRGISVSSTLLQFDYDGYRVNLLDTPGHRDFSEDTYRVLTAVDSVIMVIDAAKGIETQTRKLFEICRRREIPIFTYINKMDRPTRHPLELIDEIEDILQLGVYPVNWPLGTGFDFKGVYDRMEKKVHLFEKTVRGAQPAPVSVSGLDDPLVKEQLRATEYEAWLEEIELLDAAGETFNAADVVCGDMTPIMFGSALNNFGVEMLLKYFLRYASPPTARSVDGKTIPTDHGQFSGFIFKILANMDPNHRDRIAFLRVCSGQFKRDMVVHHSRTGQKVKLSNTRKMFGQERDSIDEAVAGDIVGIVGRSGFGIGDTLTENKDITYKEIPRFTPECFMYFRNPNPSNYKKFKKGMDQLLEEGVVQELIREEEAHQQNMRLLAAVGPLQFEVVKFRLEAEYGAESRLEPAPWQVLRWISPEVTREALRDIRIPSGCTLARDLNEHHALLLPSVWTVNYFTEKNPDIELSDVPYDL